MRLNETYSKVRIGKHLPDSFPIQNGLKQGDASSRSASGHTSTKDHLKMCRSSQNQPYAGDVNLLGDIIDTIEKNTETLTDASNEVGLQRNEGKTKYMLLSRDQQVKIGT
jgi:uncharacterized protein YdeI (BOF family)